MAIQTGYRERTNSKIDKPKRYNVVMHNDDFTTMEFVVEILIEIFRKDAIEAERIMLFVHQKGKAIVGSYPLDIANTKVNAAMTRAKEQGFPFRVTVEEA